MSVEIWEGQQCLWVAKKLTIVEPALLYAIVYVCVVKFPCGKLVLGKLRKKFREDHFKACSAVKADRLWPHPFPFFLS